LALFVDRVNKRFNEPNSQGTTGKHTMVGQNILKGKTHVREAKT